MPPRHVRLDVRQPLVADRPPDQVASCGREGVPGEVQQERRLDARHVRGEGIVTPRRIGKPVGESLRPVLHVRHGDRIARRPAQILGIAGQQPLDGKRHAVVRHVDPLVGVAAEPIRRVQPVLAHGGRRVQRGLRGGIGRILRHHRGVGWRRTDLPQALQVGRIQQQAEPRLAGRERPVDDRPGKGIHRGLPRRLIAAHQQPAEPRLALPLGHRPQTDAHPFQSIAPQRPRILVLAVVPGLVLHHRLLTSVYGCIHAETGVRVQPNRQTQPRVPADRQSVGAGQLHAAGARPAQLVPVAMVAAPVRPAGRRRPAAVGGEGPVPEHLDHRLAAIDRHRGSRPADARFVHFGHSSPMEPSACTMIGRS